MARARNIKPGLYKNEYLAECSIWARYLFPGLWTLADREGRLEDRPKRIKGELLPFDAHDVEPLLKELDAKGFIIRYEADGQRFIQITKFMQHQSPHYSEKPSAIKPPKLPESSAHIDSPNSRGLGLLKAVSQPPDSLIPDSLIPDSLIPESLEKRVGIAPNGARHANDVSEIVITLPLREGGEFEVMKPLVAEVEPLCPAVDVPATLKEMKLWLVGNPDRRKTRKGIKRFITNWLKAEQEKHGR